MNKSLFLSLVLTVLATATVSATTLPDISSSESNDTTLTYRGRRIVVSDDGQNVSVSVNDNRGRSLTQVYVSTSDSTRKEETWQVENDFTFSDLLPATGLPRYPTIAASPPTPTISRWASTTP